VPGQFPTDLLDHIENPPIYITSPPESPLPPPFSLANGGTGTFAYSPTSSPTSPEFPPPQDGRGHVKRMRVDESSFSGLGLDHSIGHHQDGSRRLLRARSDSAPHGIGLGHYLTSAVPQQGRPRSGSSLSGYQPQHQPGGVKDEFSLSGMGLDLGL
jgi:hypothetical protein